MEKRYIKKISANAELAIIGALQDKAQYYLKFASNTKVNTEFWINRYNETQSALLEIRQNYWGSQEAE